MDDNNKNNEKKEEILNNPEINETDLLMKQLDQLSLTEDKSFDDPFSFKKNTITHQTSGDLIENFYLNMQQQPQPQEQSKEPKEKDFSKITFNSIDNIDNIGNNGKKDILKLKLDNILTSLRLSDIKLNIKYYGSLLKFNDYFKDNKLVNNYYDQMNDLFNVIIELIFVIKKENEKNESNNKNNKTLAIAKLEKALIYKDSQIKDLINKLKIEKQNLIKFTKDYNNELSVLKKENNELYFQISVYKEQIKKTDANNIILEEKLNNLISEQLNRRSVSSKTVSDTSNKIMNINTNTNTNNISDADTPSTSTPNSKTNYSNETNKKSNKFSDKKNNNKDINQNIKKMNINLIDLINDINRLLEEYDSILNKASNIMQSNMITNFSNMNILKDYDKIDNLYKLFLENRDKILIKILKLIENNEQNQIKLSKDLNNTSNQKYYSSSNGKNSGKFDSKIMVNKKNLFNKTYK